MNKEDLKIIANHSDITPTEINKILEDYYYPNKALWQKLLLNLFLGLGILFIGLGAFLCIEDVWEEITKTQKIYAAWLGFILSLSLAIVYIKNRILKDWLWLGAGILLGCILYLYILDNENVNSLDEKYFIAYWFIGISIFSFLSKSPIVWLINIVMVYFLVDAQIQQTIIVNNIVLVFYAFLLILFTHLERNKLLQIPLWFIHALGIYMSIFSVATLLIYNRLFDLFISLFVGIAIYFLGKERKSLFFIGIGLFMLALNMLNYIFFKLNISDILFLFFYGLSLLIITSAIIKYLSKLNKKY